MKKTTNQRYLAWRRHSQYLHRCEGHLRTNPLQMTCFAASLARNETRTIPTLRFSPNRDRSVHNAKPIGLIDEDYKSIINNWPSTLARQKIYSSLVFGICPLRNPKIALAVIIEGKDDTLWGRHTAPIAKAILTTFYQKYVLPYQQKDQEVKTTFAMSDERIE